jgi:hypothetical protein
MKETRPPVTNQSEGPTKEPSPKLPVDVLRLLRRWAAIAWVGWLFATCLLWGQYQARVLHPWSLLFLLLFAITFLAVLATVLTGLWRVVRGPVRGRAVAWVLAGLLPLLLWLVLVKSALDQLWRAEVRPSLPLTLTAMAGASLMEAFVGYVYPHRLETERFAMFYDDQVTDPEGDIRTMDRHVARMEQETGLPLRAKIYWVRGPLLGREYNAFLGLALSSSHSPAGVGDRHELAHAVLNQHNNSDTEPPMLLGEGWAESQCKDSKTLAQSALAYRQLLAAWGQIWGRLPESERQQFVKFLVDPEEVERQLWKAWQAGGVTSHLRELTDPFWYHHDKGPVYSVGGAFVDFLLRRYGPKRFVELYFACRPGTFEADCQRVYGIDLDSLEKQFWEDAERLVGDQHQLPK